MVDPVTGLLWRFPSRDEAIFASWTAPGLNVFRAWVGANDALTINNFEA